MHDLCPIGFDESLISGYLDRELTQAEEQRVRIHIEDCAFCRKTHDELEALREATMTTEFSQPTDSQWDERAQTPVSRASRWLGWPILLIWLVAVTAFGAWHVWQASEGLLERLLVFGGLCGVALLFVSVLADRIRSAKTDPYREVQK